MEVRLIRFDDYADALGEARTKDGRLLPLLPERDEGMKRRMEEFPLDAKEEGLSVLYSKEDGFFYAFVEWFIGVLYVWSNGYDARYFTSEDEANALLRGANKRSRMEHPEVGRIHLYEGDILSYDRLQMTDR